MSKTVLLKRSNVLNEDGTPKEPTDLEYGELAMNYNEDNMALFAKNSGGNIVNLLSSDATLAELTSAITAHIEDDNNPHRVSKSDVGLGNVDNTADIDKPISTATQTALNTKLSASDVVNNLTTNDSTKALSAAQGMVLKQQLADAQASAGSDTAAVLQRLNALGQEISGIEEEVDGAVAQADAIIAREDAMLDSTNVEYVTGEEPDIYLG